MQICIVIPLLHKSFPQLNANLRLWTISFHLALVHVVSAQAQENRYYIIGVNFVGDFLTAALLVGAVNFRSESK